MGKNKLPYLDISERKMAAACIRRLVSRFSHPVVLKMSWDPALCPCLPLLRLTLLFLLRL